MRSAAVAWLQRRGGLTSGSEHAAVNVIVKPKHRRRWADDLLCCPWRGCCAGALSIAGEQNRREEERGQEGRKGTGERGAACGGAGTRARERERRGATTVSCRGGGT